MNNHNQFSKTIIRTIVYGSIVGGLILIFLLDANQRVDLVNYHKFSENSFTQWSQLLFLTLTIATFFLIGRADSDLKFGTTIVCLFFLMAIIRERGDYSDLVRDDFWKPGVLIVSAIFIWKLITNRKEFRGASIRFFQTSASGYFIAGIIITFIFSRLYGLTSNWENLMEDGYMRSVKNASEESIETLGYAFILIGAIDFLLHLRRKSKKD